MRLDLVKAIEGIVQVQPGAMHLKNGRVPQKLLPGQEQVTSELTTSKYVLPMSIDGKSAKLIAVHFTYDKRISAGWIRMSDGDIEILVDRSEGKIREIASLYRVLKEDEKKIRADIRCYKCGHVIVHECW